MHKDYSKYFAPSIKAARKRINPETHYYAFDLDSRFLGLGHNLSYVVKTYGCQGNLADSEKIAGIMEALGYQEATSEEIADVIFFNTCAIRDTAEQRVFGELGRIKHVKKSNPHAIIIVCGCMPQEETTVDLINKKYHHIDIVFGTHNIHKLPEYLFQYQQDHKRIVDVMSYEGDIVERVPLKRAHEKKAWVNIMYGCDEFCTYCIVPYTRGKERSRHPQDIITEVENLAKEGYLEVTLLGQNVNAYGNDLDMSYSFAQLLIDLQKTTIKRIRFTTSHPKDLDDETIRVMGSGGNIMPHLHLPVQSGSNKVLQKMNRKYTKEMYLEKIEKLREVVPGISITTDMIVGFPTEEEEDFLETLDLVEKANFEGAFTFIFSPREGTPANTFVDTTPNDVKKQRLQRLNELINAGYLKGNKRFENTTVDVLVDGVSMKNDQVLTGYTPHNKVVNFVGPKLLVGKIVAVEIEKAYSWHLKGKLKQ